MPRCWLLVPNAFSDFNIINGVFKFLAVEWYVIAS